MQGLVKSPRRVSSFIPHAAGISADRKSSAPLTTVPVLRSERFDQLAHDARNVLSALRLYCDLLAEPGVLTPMHGHYAQELQAVTDTAARLVEKLSAPRRDASRRSAPKANHNLMLEKSGLGKAELVPAVGSADPWPGEKVNDLGAELRGMQSLLAAIAGPRVELEIATLACGGRTHLSKEDLTRVMLNLVRNASEAMPEAGKLRITAQYGDGLSFLDAEQVPDARPRSVVIAIEDNGPGIPEELREQIFIPGFSTREAAPNWPEIQHRGLGLSIVRDLIEAAGGSARACPAPGGGARFELELPITSGMYEITDNCGLVADSAMKGCIECP